MWLILSIVHSIKIDDMFTLVRLFFSDTLEEQSFITYKICLTGDVNWFKSDKVVGVFANVFT